MMKYKKPDLNPGYVRALAEQGLIRKVRPPLIKVRLLMIDERKMKQNKKPRKT